MELDQLRWRRSELEKRMLTQHPRLLSLTAPLDGVSRTFVRLVSRIAPVKVAFACDPDACDCNFCGPSTCCYVLICC